MLEINSIYNNDCIEGMKKIDDSSVDLIITSPPYNIGIDYDVYMDTKPYQDYLAWCKQWLEQCFRILKDDGRICINHYIAYQLKGDASQFPLFDFRNIMTDIGFHVHKLAIWEDKTRVKYTAWGSYLSASAPNMTTPYEGILIAYKNNWKKNSKGKSTINKETFLEGVSGVWNLGTTVGYTKACFPEKLPYMCIQLFSYEGDLVLDPFSGSGTTCYVAKSLNRNYIGFELSEAYWAESISRLNGSPYKVQKEEKVEDKTSLW